jgi:Xaa-Pro aminopeptidase
MAYGEHGAIVHYSATKKTDAEIGADNFLLSDTGGHYQDGTTDITRTIVPAADSLSEEQKRHYTLVLKANLNLLNAKFPAGVCGNSLDALAREPLWAAGLDFNHGTGHGVGYLLSVHEGPNAFRTYRGKGKADMTAIVPGMITSDEPGLYLEGKYGIRLENLIECVEEENGFYGFRPLTFVPFDRDAIEPSLLNKDEKMILNSYHQQVYDKIGIYLSKEEKSWLQQQTAPIG